MLENGQRVEWCGALCKGKLWKNSIPPSPSFVASPVTKKKKSMAYSNDNSMINYDNGMVNYDDGMANYDDSMTSSAYTAPKQPIKSRGSYSDTSRVSYSDTSKTSKVASTFAYSDTSKVAYLDTSTVAYSDTSKVAYSDTPKVAYSDTSAYPVTTPQTTNSVSVIYLTDNSIINPIYTNQPIQPGVAYSNTYPYSVATPQLTNQVQPDNRNFQQNSQRGLPDTNQPKSRNDELKSVASSLAKTAAKAAAETAVKIAARAVVKSVLGV
ncbi:19280_t:CDS:1 [Cetraspora pellucida]|uniref:19280_t:CDS:1 n=1 Tax=Cetraspora pellucida TaxID=1433469 RepID=A0A9N9H701_9GLOM|nr:19280_t:CDS:1 [Cetraspora pellucida]